MTNILKSTESITVEQFTILKALIDADNRVEFYLKLNEFTGSKAALLMAQISSSSGTIGGTAWAINGAYDLALPGYPEEGVEFFSRAIASFDLASFKYEVSTDSYTVPSDQSMLINARQTWKMSPVEGGVDLGYAFPGNFLIAINFIAANEWNSALPYLNDALKTAPLLAPLGIGEAFWEGFDSHLNSGKSIQEMLQIYPGSRLELRNNGAISAVIGADGKTLGAFVDSQFDTLPLTAIANAKAWVADIKAQSYALWNSMGAGSAQQAGLMPVFDVMGNVTGFTEITAVPVSSGRDPANDNYIIDVFADGARHRYPASTTSDGTVLVLGNGVDSWVLPSTDGSGVAIARNVYEGTIITRYLDASGKVQREEIYQPRVHEDGSIDATFYEHETRVGDVTTRVVQDEQGFRETVTNAAGESHRVAIDKQGNASSADDLGSGIGVDITVTIKSPDGGTQEKLDILKEIRLSKEFTQVLEDHDGDGVFEINHVRAGSGNADSLLNDHFVADTDHPDLQAIADATGISLSDLLDYNPGLSSEMSLVPGLEVVLPPAHSDFELHITPELLPQQNGPLDPTSGGPSANQSNLLIDSASYEVSGLGDVNTVTGNQQAANANLSDDFRPGAHEVLPDNGTALDLFYGSDPLSPALVGPWVNLEAGDAGRWIPVDPLILDLDGDGVRLTSFAEAPVLFDIDHDGGSKEITGWVAGLDGIVAIDLNGNGRIDDISETLSEYFNGAAGSNGAAGEKPYRDGFAALASLDDNHDGQFTAADAAWRSIRVWQDADHDAVTGDGELKTLDELGISAISLASTSQSGRVSGGNEILAGSTFMRKGASAEVLAARFIANPTGSTRTGDEADGSVTTGEDGQSTYVAAGSKGETIDLAAHGVKNAYGGSGDDILHGDAGANWLAGGQGADVIDGGAGDDMLIVDAADRAQDIHGGAGFDMLQVVGEGGVRLDLAAAGIEVAVGGSGNDVLIGAGRSSVFVRGGDGDDVLIGGAAGDALSGENGDDLLDGGAGNDVVRGGRGSDALSGSAGDDLLAGGQDDDKLNGGQGNDVLKGEQGDDLLDGGAGIDTAEFSGSFADYRLTRLAANRYRIVDRRQGGDGADTLTDIEKLSFSDVSGVDITLDNPLPAGDTVATDAQGQAMDRHAAHLIAASQLLANDRDWQGDRLHISTVLDAVGGSAVLTAAGDVLFTPAPGFQGIMGFKYRIADADGSPGATAVDLASGTNAEMKAAVWLLTPDMPRDPMLPQQWTITDANILPVWQDYSGRGVRIGQFEPGMPFSTGPQIFDYRHADLWANADPAWLADPAGAIPQSFSEHATMVAGVMVGERNGQGGVGVAYGATLAGHYFNGGAGSGGLETNAIDSELDRTLALFQNYDVVNNSWGSSANFGLNVLPVGGLEHNLTAAVQYGRHGLGTAIVFAAGNERADGGSANANALINNRAVITVGAINAPGDIGTLQFGARPFSNPGANILVSAPGSNIASTGESLLGPNGAVLGKQYSSSQGTSFAAPIVSGVIALMLEANPQLGYRDIQAILVASARQFDDPNGTDWTYNAAGNWNGGGMHASTDYGFGKVDALAAVRLAQSWTRSSLFEDQGVLSAEANVEATIPDGSASLISSVTLAGGMEVEHAQVTLSLEHLNWGDLVIKLISPGGTQSLLLNRPGKAPGSGDGDRGDAGSLALDFSFGSTHVRGEDSAGTWTLEVSDAVTGATGVLKNWKLELYGRKFDTDDMYVYTDEYAGLAAADGARRLLADSDGGSDTLNVAVMSGDNLIDLRADGDADAAASAGLPLATGSRLNGQALHIAAGNQIEHAIGGDGADTLIGNALGNHLSGGRGNDSLAGGAGDDLLDGGAGDDRMSGGSGRDVFVLHRQAGSRDVITDFDAATERIVLSGFGAMDFADLVLTQEQDGVHVVLGSAVLPGGSGASAPGAGGGQSLLLSGVNLAVLNADAFVFVERDNVNAVTIIDAGAQDRIAAHGGTNADSKIDAAGTSDRHGRHWQRRRRSRR